MYDMLACPFFFSFSSSLQFHLFEAEMVQEFLGVFCQKIAIVYVSKASYTHAFKSKWLARRLLFFLQLKCFERKTPVDTVFI